jgi:hypothetical protein
MSKISEPGLLVLQTLRVKGFVDTEAVAETVSLTQEDTLNTLNKFAEEGRVSYREGRMAGWMLTSDGRSYGEQLLATEVDNLGIRLGIETSYTGFLQVNEGFLGLCTDWQLKPSLDENEEEPVINDHSDPDYDKGVIDRLVELDKHVQPICASLAEQLERFVTYGDRFTYALELVLKGDTDWFTKPMIESYHTVWFELHENLLSTLGIDRASENSSE